MCVFFCRARFHCSSFQAGQPALALEAYFAAIATCSCRSADIDPSPDVRQRLAVLHANCAACCLLQLPPAASASATLQLPPAASASATTGAGHPQANGAASSSSSLSSSSSAAKKGGGSHAATAAAASAVATASAGVGVGGGAAAQALRYADDALRYDARYAKAVFRRAEALAALGRGDEAAAVLREAAQRQQGPPLQRY